MVLSLIIALLADQISKAIVSSMEGYMRIALVPGVLWVVKVTNTGMAFGMFSTYTDVITIVSIIVAVFLSLLPVTADIGRLGRVSLGMIVGGALGNIIDRVRFGRVLDFIELRYFPAIFNLADAFITIGGLLFVLAYIWRERCEDRGHAEGERLETGQASSGQASEVDIEVYDTEGDKRRESTGERGQEETQLQSEERRDGRD